MLNQNYLYQDSQVQSFYKAVYAKDYILMLMRR